VGTASSIETSDSLEDSAALVRFAAELLDSVAALRYEIVSRLAVFPKRCDDQKKSGVSDDCILRMRRLGDVGIDAFRRKNADITLTILSTRWFEGLRG